MDDYPTKEKAIYELYLCIKWILWMLWDSIPVYW